MKLFRNATYVRNILYKNAFRFLSRSQIAGCAVVVKCLNKERESMFHSRWLPFRLIEIV